MAGKKAKDNSEDTTEAAASGAAAETGDIPEIDNPHEGNINLDGVVGPEETAGATPKDPLDAMTAERDELKDRLLRALAEVENMRARSERDVAAARKYGHAGFARDLLGAVDNLGRAVEALPDAKVRDGLDDALKNLVLGVEMVSNEIGGILERHGITRIAPLGEKFDPERHQAMFEKPDGLAEPGTVVEVVRPGWMLHDRLLTPAMVAVAKKPVSGEPVTGEPATGEPVTGEPDEAGNGKTGGE